MMTLKNMCTSFIQLSSVLFSGFLILTLCLLPTPGVFWISHMPSAKPLMRTPPPYFILFPTYGTMFPGGRWPLRKEQKLITVQPELWTVNRGAETCTYIWWVPKKKTGTRFLLQLSDLQTWAVTHGYMMSDHSSEIRDDVCWSCSVSAFSPWQASEGSPSSWRTPGLLVWSGLWSSPASCHVRARTEMFTLEPANVTDWVIYGLPVSRSRWH